MKRLGIVRIISNASLSIKGLDGKRTIMAATDIFKWISPCFKEFGLDKPGKATDKIIPVVSEVAANGTFLQIFFAISPNLKKSVITQGQVIEFCNEHPDWLRQEGAGTLFLIEEQLNIFQNILLFIFDRYSKYFVVRVYVGPDGLHIFVRSLKDNHVHSFGKQHPRVVSPRLLRA